MIESVKRWVRGHRPDGNPLRRRSDRLESAALAMAALLVLLSVWPAVMAGREAYEEARHAGAARRTVEATLLADAPVTRLSFGEVSRGGLTSARWTAPSGLERTGQVPAPSLAKAGAKVRIWVGPDGRRVAAPPSPAELRVTAVVTALLFVTVAAAIALLAFAGFRRVLDRGRYRAWEAAWALSAERWRRPRPS
ncbi:Rv1733c family protein [Nonomuraea helvata]|uniref:Transmembrane protein n=1 Tax=Nonomuraea helvata TaxID=37484 RepID=A0ABV5SDK2_9ACTN